MRFAVLAAAVLALFPVTARADKPAPPPPPPPTGVADKDIDSADILARTPVTIDVEVKHILIAWDALAPNFNGHIDPRAEHRTNAEAAAIAQALAARLRADPTKINALMKSDSEDPSSAATGTTYTVTAAAAFVPELKALALRLHANEVGIVRSVFGYHIVLRLPPDPLVSTAILARPQLAERAFVQHVLIGWDGTATDPRGKARSKHQADELARATLAKVRAGANMTKLMADLSEDPGSAPSGKVYEVTPTATFRGQFRDLALRLRVGEAGLVKTELGWHVVKRVAPPPPDPLESGAILARKPVTAKAKVKHILVGWIGAHTEDERGVHRSRAELAKLVAATVARLRKGEPIEPLMAELSEDPGSAKDGRSYDVTPDAGLVKPFLDLSLRLELGEVGVVKTDFGMHIIKRVE